MAETMWHTVLQSQVIHPDWSAQEHLDFLEEEGFDITTLKHPRTVESDKPIDIVQNWLDVNPTLPMFQREVERMGHFMKVELRSLEEGDEIIDPGNDSGHKVYRVDVSGQYVRVDATAWVREGYIGKEKVLRVVKPTDVHAGTYALPTGTTVKVDSTGGHWPFLGVIMGAVYNGPAGSLVKSYLVLPDGAKTVEICEPRWISIRKAP